MWLDSSSLLGEMLIDFFLGEYSWLTDWECFLSIRSILNYYYSIAANFALLEILGKDEASSTDLRSLAKDLWPPPYRFGNLTSGFARSMD